MPPPAAVDVLVLCTGNAARSVMAGYMLEYLAEAGRVGLPVTTAGTHTVDGQPMGLRTRAALVADRPRSTVPVARHRSRQLEARELAAADLVVAMEADHVRYVRRSTPPPPTARPPSAGSAATCPRPRVRWPSG